MSVKCWVSVAGAGQYPFSPSQYFMLVEVRTYSIHALSAYTALIQCRTQWPGVTVLDYPPVQVTPGGNLKIVSSYPL